MDVEDVAIAVETEEKLGWGVKASKGPPIAIRKEEEEKFGHRRHSKKRSRRPSPNPNHRPTDNPPTTSTTYKQHHEIIKHEKKQHGMPRRELAREQRDARHHLGLR